ncbi:hypothetical protein KLF50_15005 (plasmid) [Clostridium perfringens]|nr:hypothetical protein [Clostridium perfringens]UBK83473.1 hypothetical protein KLF50_15005 [Clostridium perfringens]
MLLCDRKRSCERAESWACSYCIFNKISRKNLFKQKDYRKEVKEHE